MDRIRWAFIIVPLISLVSYVLLHTRTSSVVSSTDELVVTAEGVLQTLRSVRDPAQAAAATAELADKLGRLLSQSESWITGAESADRRGGVTKQGLEKIEQVMTRFGSLLAQVGQECDRLRGTPGLPLEFCNLVRGEIIQIGMLWGDAAAKHGTAEAELPMLRSIAKLYEEFGAPRVVMLKMPGASPARLAEAAAQVKSKLGANAQTVETAIDDVESLYVAPVEDFESFASGLGLGEVAVKDSGMRLIEIGASSPADAQAAAEPPDAVQSNETLNSPIDNKSPGPSASFGEPGPPGRSFAGGPPSRPGPEFESADASRMHDELMQRHLENQGFPNPSDPGYYRKLCDLMVDEENWSLNDEAIDAVLKIQPQDIPEKAVRQEIARNFRELALKDSAGTDREKAIRGLIAYGGKFSVPILIEILKDSNTEAPEELFKGLGTFPDPRGAEAACQQLGNFFNHDSAVSALRMMGPVAEDALLKVAPSNDADVSLAAIKLLGETGTKKSLRLLAQAAKSRNREVSLAAKAATLAVMERTRSAAQ